VIKKHLILDHTNSATSVTHMTRFEEGVFEPLEHVGFLDRCGEVSHVWNEGLQKSSCSKFESKQLLLVEMVCIKQVWDLQEYLSMFLLKYKFRVNFLCVK
jgi:hypothetical protein